MLLRRYAPVVTAAGALMMISMMSAPGVRADAAAEARKTIQAAMDRESAAIAKKDLNGAFAICAPDFVARDAGGAQMSLPGMRRELEVVFQNVSAIKSVSAIQKFALKGGQATMIVKTHTEMTLNAPPKVKPSHGVNDEVKEDIWVKRGGIWQRKDSKLISQAPTRDGKPVKTR